MKIPLDVLRKYPLNELTKLERFILARDECDRVRATTDEANEIMRKYNLDPEEHVDDEFVRAYFAAMTAIEEGK